MTNHQATKPPSVTHIVNARRADGQIQINEVVAEDPVAIVFNGTTAAVMMATPSDLRDLAFGFALTEGYIASLEDVESFEVVQHEQGIEARFWVSDLVQKSITDRRRAMAGPVGCGICGVESLDAVRRPVRKVAATLKMTEIEITQAMAAISEWQPLKQATRSTHAAGLYIPGSGIVAAREDVGRHNALDKLAGHLAQARIGAASGAIVMTSRLSLELVQKCAFLGSSMLIAPSGPTSLAISTAKDKGIQLIGFCRGTQYRAFC